ncbi:MAG: metalloregulator ArsR/SmtB family transcription factor [Pseudomonadota bacterium]|jgi:ArsR family transcriptional regulator
MNNLVTPLKALAHETRFKILNLLMTHDLCVGALSGRIGISKAAISQHLQVLRKAGLVKGEKRGYWTHYSVERAVLRQIADELSKRADQVLRSEGICHRAFATETNIGERRGMNMCKDCCEHPEKLKGKPEDCAPDQIKECHGDTKDHPCETEKK